MKHVILAAFGLLATHVSWGQQTEYSMHLNSGGSAYRGPFSRSGSVFTISDTGNVPFETNSPYSKKLGFSYGLAAQVQRVNSAQDIFGLQAGYEVLRNRTTITEIEGFRFRVPASGHLTLTNQFVTAHPFFGHRFAREGVALDLTAGPEAGLLCRSHLVEKITTDNGPASTAELDRDKPKMDVRARLNVAAYYKHVGLTLGYSRGLINQYDGSANEWRETYAQVFRLGLAYRL